jgi:uncharacterized protein (TIGR03437 family)
VLPAFNDHECANRSGSGAPSNRTERRNLNGSNINYDERLRVTILFIVCLGHALAQTIPPFFESTGQVYVGRRSAGLLQIAGGGITLKDKHSLAVFSMKWADSSTWKLEGAEPTGGVTNYLLGNDPTAWRLGVIQYASVRAKEVYRGIDVIYYFQEQELEFDMIISPGADLSIAVLSFAGQKDVRLGSAGDLLIATAQGSIRFRRPNAFQIRGGRRERVKCVYALKPTGRVAFELGEHDRSLPVVVDPVIETMSYLGGAGSDHIQAIAVDGSGSPIVAGVTSSDNLPGITHPSGSVSIFVTKVNAASTKVIYTTVLGSRANANPAISSEAVYSLAADTQGNAFIAGTTFSSDFPTTSQAWQRQSFGGFVAQLDSNGAPVYSTFLGPSAWALAPVRLRLNNGIAYIGGQVSRPEFLGTQGALQRNVAGASDFFVTALKSDGSGPVFVTAFGGSGGEFLSDFAIDRDGNIVLVGSSGSTDLPTTDSLGFSAPAVNSSEAVLVRIDASGTRLLYSAWLGNLSLSAVEASPDGELLIASGSPIPASLASMAPHYSPLFPVNGAIGYIAKWSASNNRPLWSTDVQSGLTQMSTDAEGNVFWSGNPIWISGGGFSTAGNSGILKLSASGAALLYGSSVFATSSHSAAMANGSVWVAGWTSLATLPTTPGVVQPNRDPTTGGSFNNPFNPDDGFLGHLDLSSFRLGNFFIPPQTVGIIWRLDQPSPPPAVVPMKIFGSGISVAVIADSPALTSAIVTDGVSINVNPKAATTAGSFKYTATVQAPEVASSSLAIPVALTVLPRVNFQVAQSHVDISFRQGQAVSFVYVPITTNFGAESFGFLVDSSDRSWLFPGIDTFNGTRLTINVGQKPVGSYDATITISLLGTQVSGIQQTVSVHYVVTAPAVYHLSTAAVSLHVDKGKPVSPATITVTSDPPGVPFSLFLGVSRTWVTATQTAKTTPGQIQVNVDVSTVEVGYFGFDLAVDGESGADTGLHIFINVDVSSGAPLDATPAAINYQWIRGGPFPFQLQLVSFTSPTRQPLQITADQPWITFGPNNVSTPYTIAASFDQTMKEGVYRGNIIAKVAGGSVTIPVTFQLYDISHIVVSSPPLHFQYTIGGAKPSALAVAVSCPTLQPAYFLAGMTSFPTFAQVDPRFGVTPATLHVTVDPSGLSPGTYTTSLEIDSQYPALQSSTRVPVTLDVLPDPNAPASTIVSVADVASFLPGPVSAGEILLVAGTGLGPTSVVGATLDSKGRFPTSVAGVTFLFDDVPAPIIYSSAAYAAIVAPFAISGKTQTSISVVNGGKQSAALTLPVAASNPAIFTANSSGTGLAAALNFFADGSSNAHSQANAAVPGGIVVVYATGLGMTSPAMVDGSVVTQPIPVLTEKIQVLIGGQSAAFDYAGPAPGEIAGAMQLNVRIPQKTASGLQPIVILSGENPSQAGVVLAIH